MAIDIAIIYYKPYIVHRPFIYINIPYMDHIFISERSRLGIKP